MVAFCAEDTLNVQQLLEIGDMQELVLIFRNAVVQNCTRKLK